ncbi:uncharacterized protein LOC108339111 [Vigna angularis]|uniref:uncharacterized protein LOC108339111 n=1 Tax=Phaseolus angularis TaxID=3914 RepID=UPI000809AA09|nr:uncharacterized protein LOC108339111 [Vigna angularis]
MVATPQIYFSNPFVFRVAVPSRSQLRYLHHLASNEEWETFMDVLALTLYGVMLFPKVEDFVDYGAIDIFVANRTRLENPIAAILADVYETLSFCHERKGQRILCCLPTLYLWLASRVFKGTVDKSIKADEWTHFFVGLNGGKIKWRPSWLRGRCFIHYCGDFPNVPLIGARYCINYNPTLVQRQFGHPMRGAPSSDYLTPLFIYYEDGCFIEKLREVRRAWGNVVRFEADERAGVINQEVSYHSWITQRVKDIKLPFKSITGRLVDERQFLNPKSDKVKQLKIEIEEMKDQNIKLIEELQNARNDVVDLTLERKEMTQAHEEALTKQNIEKGYTLRIK